MNHNSISNSAYIVIKERKKNIVQFQSLVLIVTIIIIIIIVIGVRRQFRTVESGTALEIATDTRRRS